MTATAQDIIQRMEGMQNREQRGILMRFFKCDEGEYGEGDEFIGLKNPQTRALVKEYRDLPLSEIPLLLASKWHEVRLCAVLIMVDKFERLSKPKLVNDDDAIRQRDEIVCIYLNNADRINNWDLVDLSVHKTIGHWLMLPSHLGDDAYKLSVIDDLAHSGHLWRQRMSMVCTWWTTSKGDPSFGLRYAEMHVTHHHDLMHKAVGWMLREIGKRCSMGLLREFLRQHLHEMSRTTLRYAIEKMDEQERQEWMKKPQ